MPMYRYFIKIFTLQQNKITAIFREKPIKIYTIGHCITYGFTPTYVPKTD